MSMINTTVLVTTDKDKRGVFFGTLQRYDSSAGEVTLTDARMCVHWPIENHGVVGLASIGPLKGSRITPQIERLELVGVTAVMSVNDEAAARFNEEPWT